jgi:diguanylate cyclase (GGDEF)-like protein
LDTELSEKLRVRIIKNTLLGCVAYAIVVTVGVVNVMLGMSQYGYKPVLAFLVLISLLNISYIVVTKRRKCIDKSYAQKMLFVQLSTWLLFFLIALFIVEELRPMLLMSSIMAITFVFTYQKFLTSIITSFIIATSYLVISYVGIYYFQQSGQFTFDLLLVCCYLPASIFIAYMADRMAKQRNELKQARRKLLQADTERQTILHQLEVIALTDDLTQLMNRRAMRLQLNRELERVKRYYSKVTLLLIDIDHFKKVNDLYGHDCGDFVLKLFSEVLSETVRDLDYVARWGGEEFLIVLSQTPKSEAYKVALRLLKEVVDHSFQYDSRVLNISFSGGLNEIDASLSIEENLKIVDELLYKAKQNGRNQISCTD